MRFRISEFEQHFSESNLEKGLRLLRRSKPVLHERSGNHLGYKVGGHLVSLQQRQQEIDHCFCDCMRKYCPHAAALMFFFLERTIGGQQSTRLRKTKLRDDGSAKFAELFTALKEHWKELTADKNDRRAHRSFLVRLEELAAKGDFTADMAVIASISLAGRLALSNDAMRLLTNRLILRHFKNRFRGEEVVLYQCVLETLRTTERAASSQFSALLPVYLSLTTNMFHLEELRVTLEKRNMKKFHADIFDELLVARTMVFFRSSQLQGGEIKLLKSNPPESFVALARLHFASQEIEAAWQVMEELRKQMRESPLGYFDFLVYLINLSEALRETPRQLAYLEELILLSPYLSSALAKKYLLLLPGSSRKERISALMKRIVETRSEGAVDKVFVLAGVSGQAEVFLQLCERQKVKFNMLHELLMNKGIQATRAETEYYFQRLPEALVQTDFYQARVLLLEKAALFLQTLDQALVQKYAEDVLGFISGYPMLHNLLPTWQELCEGKALEVRL